MAAESVKEWTRDEILEILEKQVWERRQMSVGEFLRAHSEGTLVEPGEVADLLALAFLLPDDDPVIASP